MTKIALLALAWALLLFCSCSGQPQPATQEPLIVSEPPPTKLEPAKTGPAVYLDSNLLVGSNGKDQFPYLEHQVREILGETELNFVTERREASIVMKLDVLVEKDEAQEHPSAWLRIGLWDAQDQLLIGQFSEDVIHVSADLGLEYDLSYLKTLKVHSGDACPWVAEIDVEAFRREAGGLAFDYYWLRPDQPPGDSRLYLEYKLDRVDEFKYGCGEHELLLTGRLVEAGIERTNRIKDSDYILAIDWTRNIEAGVIVGTFTGGKPYAIQAELVLSTHGRGQQEELLRWEIRGRTPTTFRGPQKFAVVGDWKREYEEASVDEQLIEAMTASRP